MKYIYKCMCVCLGFFFPPATKLGFEFAGEKVSFSTLTE